MKYVFAIITFFSINSIAYSQTQIPVYQSSPQEKFIANIFYSGAYTVNQAPQCSYESVLRLVGPKLLQQSALLRFNNNQTKTVGELSLSFANDISKILNKLIASGDSELAKHHICVGAYDYGFVVNAISYSAGFILFDPKVVKYAYEELPKRSMYSIKQVLYHELAHQFQYWYGNKYMQDITARHSELTADCVGAALSTLELAGVSQEIWNASAPGIVEAVSSLGDFETHSKNHHGTPQERAQAAVAGINLMRNWLLQKTPVLSRTLLNKCEEMVK